MRRLLIKRMIVVVSIFTLLYTCKYDEMTHMSDYEVEWVTNRHEGEIMYLKSQDGVVDTVTILEVYVDNLLDPINWGYFNTSSRVYIASAGVRYSINHERGAILQIYKRNNSRPICFSSVLDVDEWLYNIPLNTTSLRISGITMNDIMFFDISKSEAVNRKDSNVIISYSWSKKYGLVQYTLKDGTVFSRALEK